MVIFKSFIGKHLINLYLNHFRTSFCHTESYDLVLLSFFLSLFFSFHHLRPLIFSFINIPWQRSHLQQNSKDSRLAVQKFQVFSLEVVMPKIRPWILEYEDSWIQRNKLLAQSRSLAISLFVLHGAKTNVHPLSVFHSTCTAKLWITKTAKLKHSKYWAGSP